MEDRVGVSGLGLRDALLVEEVADSLVEILAIPERLSSGCAVSDVDFDIVIGCDMLSLRPPSFRRAGTWIHNSGVVGEA